MWRPAASTGRPARAAGRAPTVPAAWSVACSVACTAALAMAMALALVSGAAPATGATPAPTATPPADAAARGPDGLLRVPALARISDPDAYLSPAQRAALDQRLASFEAEHGSQVAVLMLASTRPEPIEDFAHRVGDAWKIGRRGIGDGVLIVVAVQDRTARIDVARSLEGAIPDLAARRLIREQMGPHFASKDYAGGINAALDGLFGLITAEALPAGPGVAAGPEPVAHRGHPDDDTLRALIPFLVGFVIAAAVLRRLLGVLGAGLAALAALGVVGFFFSSLLLGAIAGIVVFVFALVGGPLMVLQVLGGRGGFSSGGGSSGGGGFRSGGGGDFSGGGASGNW